MSEPAQEQLSQQAQDNMRTAEAVESGSGDAIEQAIQFAESQKQEGGDGDPTDTSGGAVDENATASDETSQDGANDDGEEVGADGALKDETGSEEAEEKLSPTGWASVKKLTKKVSQLQDSQKRLERSYEQAQQELDAARQEIENERALLRDDPFKVLEKYGHTYDTLTDRILGDGKPGEGEQAARAKSAKDQEILELKSKIAQLETVMTRNQANEIIDNYKKEVSSVVDSNEFEFLNYDGAKDEVYSVAYYFAAEAPEGEREDLTPQEAARRLNEYLRERNRSSRSREAAANGLGASNSPAESSANGGTAPRPQVSGDDSPKTLSNNLAASRSSPSALDGPMSEQDELEAAVRMIGG